jgi:hypothetical protein
MHIGHIVVQWGALLTTIDIETDFIRGMPGMTDGLRNEQIRSEAKWKLDFLRRSAEVAFEGCRAGATKSYQRNISHICRHKGVRDALAHGTFSQQDNEGFSGAVVHYKRRKLWLSMRLLSATARGIGECNGFLFSFRDWLHAEQMLKMLQASRERSLGHTDPPTNPETRDKP